MGIYGVLPPLWKSQKDLGEGLVRGAVIPVFFFFPMWIILKVFNEFVTILFLFLFWFLWL